MAPSESHRNELYAGQSILFNPIILKIPVTHFGDPFRISDDTILESGHIITARKLPSTICGDPVIDRTGRTDASIGHNISFSNGPTSSSFSSSSLPIYTLPAINSGIPRKEPSADGITYNICMTLKPSTFCRGRRHTGKFAGRAERSRQISTCRALTI